MRSTVSFQLPPSRRILKALCGIVLGLAVLSLMGQYARFVLGHARLMGFVPEFSLGDENNIPTYFSGLLLLATALALGTIARSKKSAAEGNRHWTGLAVIFAYLSVDEVTSLHERLAEPTTYFVEAEGLLFYTWVLPGAVLVAIFVAAYLGFFWRLPMRFRQLFAVAGTLYVGGALGVESIGGWYHAQQGETFALSLLVTVEEGMEMVGSAVFFYAVLEYLREEVPGVHCQLQPVLEDEQVAGEQVADERTAGPCEPSLASARPSHETSDPTRGPVLDANRGG